jgi:hypothetical protein
LIQGKEPAVPIGYEAGWDPRDVLDVMEKREIITLHLPGIEPFAIQPIAYGLLVGMLSQLQSSAS